MDAPPPPRASNRILRDVPCVVCQDHSSGKHYGVYACDGCAGFFKRSVRRQRSYPCTANTPGRCLIDRVHRNQCRSCRFQKCLEAGMNRDAVQHERGPRNSTIRRHMSFFINDRGTNDMRREINGIVSRPIVPTQPINALNAFIPLLYGNLMDPAVIPPPRSMQDLAVTSSLAINREITVTCEAAAKILFIIVKSAKSMEIFERLPIADRLLLLSETWRDLFVLGAAQFLYPTDLRKLLNSRNVDLRQLEYLQKTMADIAKLKLDNKEHKCLRGIILFNADSLDEAGSELQDLRNVAAEQNRHRGVLNEYVAITHPLAVSRTRQLLELLPIIRQVSSLTIVDLFFRAVIQDIPIERIICDMYKSA